MLFQSNVDQVFRRMNIIADNAASDQRKSDAALRLNLYHGEQTESLYEELSKHFSEPEKLLMLPLNIVRKIVDNVTTLYLEPPLRSLEGTERDQKLFQTITEQAALDVRLKLGSRYLTLLGAIVLRPVWRGNRVDLDILTPNLVDVEWGDTPEELRKILVTHYGSSNRIEDVAFSYWDEAEFRRLDHRGNTLEAYPNPYGRLPFLPVFAHPPQGDFWISTKADLIRQQTALNMKLTDLVHLLAMQSYGIGVVKGMTGAGAMRMDAGNVVEIPADGDLFFADQKAKIEESITAIEKLVKLTVVSHGLSAGSMSTDPQEASGLSKLVDNLELKDARADQVSAWRAAEKRLFDLIRLVHNTHAATKLSESATMSVDFADLAPTVDPDKQAQAWERLFGLGVISQVDILLEMNPDLTREQAMETLLKIQEETRTLTE